MDHNVNLAGHFLKGLDHPVEAAETERAVIGDGGKHFHSTCSLGPATGAPRRAWLHVVGRLRAFAWPLPFSVLGKRLLQLPRGLGRVAVAIGPSSVALGRSPN